MKNTNVEDPPVSEEKRLATKTDKGFETENDFFHEQKLEFKQPVEET